MGQEVILFYDPDTLNNFQLHHSLVTWFHLGNCSVKPMTAYLWGAKDFQCLPDTSHTTTDVKRLQ